MIWVRDSFDDEEYPVYVLMGQSPQSVVVSCAAPDMQQVRAVYSLSLDLEPQLAQFRPMNYHVTPQQTPQVTAEELAERFDAAKRALFAVEEALGPPSHPDRTAVYALRCDLAAMGARLVSARRP
jgi:hypothetical protein